MKKYPIGFNTRINKEKEINKPMEICKGVIEPKKSVVRVYFPSRCTSWAYFNDSFDLKIGDFVYVEGKLEGEMGQVTEVNYSFKIKRTDYKKVIALVDTSVYGDLFFQNSHLVSFSKAVLPFEKVRTWFNAPVNDEEFEVNHDHTKSFMLEDLLKININREILERGHRYFMDNRVAYLCVDGIKGYAVVEGSKNYEVEFDYYDGEISNLKCTCFCSGICKHQFASMLQLTETLDQILKNYEDKYDGYFAAISKGVFMNIVMERNSSGKISLEV